MDPQGQAPTVTPTAEDKAAQLEAGLTDALTNIARVLPDSDGKEDVAYEVGLMGTLDHDLALVTEVNQRLTKLAETVGLVRP